MQLRFYAAGKIRDIKGFSLVEVMIAAGILTFMVLVASALLSGMDFGGRADVDQALLDLRTMVNVPANCTAALGGLVISSTAPTSVDIIRPGSSPATVFLYGTPTATQNILRNGWQISSLQTVPVSDVAQSFDAGKFFLFVNLSFVAVSPAGLKLSRQLPVALRVSPSGPNYTIIDCSVISSNAGKPVPLPTCATNQRLALVASGPNVDPQWICQ